MDRIATSTGARRMRIYHFIDAKWGLDDIRQRRLKISRIGELNDPFEFLAFSARDKDVRRAFQQTKEEISKTKGILCFSKNWRNPLLWSHYADSHRGLCLGFEIKTERLDKIRYISHRPEPDLEILSRSDGTEEKYMQTILGSKFSHWRYEQEYRLFVELSDLDDASENYFVEFGPEMELKEIFVGEFSTLRRGDLTAALGGLSDDVSIVKTRRAFRSFRVVKQQDRSRW